MKPLALLPTLLASWLALAAPSASALELNGRRLEVSSGVDTKTAMKLVTDMMNLDEASDDPIFLMVTGGGGTAQGVLLLADGIRAIKAPVVSVVMGPVHGATAAASLFADRVVMLPSAQLVLTEVDYEGVPRPPEVKADDPNKKEPTRAEAFLQRVRKDFLDRFWGVVSKRLNEKATILPEVEAQGGKVITADQALQRKIAFEIVATLETERSPTEKLETKITTTRNLTKTAPPKASSN
jgi:ATP-dependent protease ClpP protease subunit